MKPAKYISLNGKLLSATEPCLSHNNRGLLFGDSFNFNCRGTSSKVFFYDMYFELILRQLEKMQMKIPKLFKPEIFKTDIELLLQKNRIYQGFELNICIFRNCSESYHVKDNSISILLSVKELPDQYFQLNQKGLLIDIYEDFLFPDELLSWYNTPVYSPDMLLINTQSSSYDNYILLNKDKLPQKAIDSELLFFHNNTFILPTSRQVQTLNIFTELISEIANKNNIKVNFTNVHIKDIVKMEEIMLFNPVAGIQWVVGFKQKRFVNKMSTTLNSEINKLAKESIS